MSKRQIRVVAGDRGGWNSIEPALLLALENGCEVFVYFVATCATQYLDSKLKVDERMRVTTGTDDPTQVGSFVRPNHDLAVVTASQSVEGATAAYHTLDFSNAPTLAMQDLYGSLAPTLNLLQEFDALALLDKVCVTDDFAANHLASQFLVRDKLVITGGPQFDKTMKVKRIWTERRRELRRAFDVSDNHLVFLVVGQLNGTVEVLHMLEAAIDEANMADRAAVIIRAHPRATDAEKLLLQQYYVTTKRNWFTDTDRSIAPTSEDLLPGVDFVLSGYSTTNLFGILYEMPGVVYIGTPALKTDLMKEKSLERPPEVEAGAAWYVQSPREMANVITTVISGEPRDDLTILRAAQQRISAYNTGNAAENVWLEMQKLMAP